MKCHERRALLADVNHDGFPAFRRPALYRVEGWSVVCPGRALAEHDGAELYAFHGVYGTASRWLVTVAVWIR